MRSYINGLICKLHNLNIMNFNEMKKITEMRKIAEQ